MSQPAEKERKNKLLRRIGAIIAAALVVFFFIHAALGATSQSGIIPEGLHWIIWAFSALIIVHIGICIGTTWFMYTDEVRPPSEAKKRHQVLKWVSGAVLLILALVHILGVPIDGRFIMLAVLAALVWHCYVGAKSVARDLGLPRGAKIPIRIILILAAVLIAVALFF